MEFIDLKAQYQHAKAAIDSRIQQVLAHGQFIHGPELFELEERLAEFVGVKYAIGVSNGTTAIEMALRALDIQPGDEVITPAFSFMATAEIPALLGAIPIMVDIDPVTYNLDPRLLTAAITPRTKAIIVVDLYGQCADYDAIHAIAAQHGIPVIEDAAQSLGASYKGRHAGGLGIIGCTSFFPAKPLGCYGDGGACFTNDPKIAEAIQALRNHGQSERYVHTRLGTNARLDTLQAAILLAKLDLFPQELALRQQVATFYANALPASINPPTIIAGNISAYAQYTIEVTDRATVQAALKAQGIPTAVHYPKIMAQQPALAAYPCAKQVFPAAERASQQVLSLPFWPYMSQTEVAQVASALTATLLTEV